MEARRQMLQPSSVRTASVEKHKAFDRRASAAGSDSSLRSPARTTRATHGPLQPRPEPIRPSLSVKVNIDRTDRPSSSSTPSTPPLANLPSPFNLLHQSIKPAQLPYRRPLTRRESLLRLQQSQQPAADLADDLFAPSTSTTLVPPSPSSQRSQQLYTAPSIPSPLRLNYSSAAVATVYRSHSSLNGSPSSSRPHTPLPPPRTRTPRRAPPTLAMSVHAPAPVFSTSPLPSPPLPTNGAGRRSRAGTQSYISRPSSPPVGRDAAAKSSFASSRRPSFDAPERATLLSPSFLQRPPMPRNASRTERLLRQTLSADDRARSRSRSRVVSRREPAPDGYFSDDGCDDDCVRVYNTIRAAARGEGMPMPPPSPHLRRTQTARPASPPPAESRTAPGSPRMSFHRAHTSGPGLPMASQHMSMPGSPVLSARRPRTPPPELSCTCGVAELSLTRATSSRGARRASTAPTTTGPGARSMIVQGAPSKDDVPEPLTPPPTPPLLGRTLSNQHRRRHSTSAGPTPDGSLVHHSTCPLAVQIEGVPRYVAAPARPRALTTSSASGTPDSASSGSGSPSGESAPGTPPATSPSHQQAFNVRTASAACRAKPGYVSFGDVEGLGVPGSLDGDDTDGEGASAAGRVKDHLLRAFGWRRP